MHLPSSLHIHVLLHNGLEGITTEFWLPEDSHYRLLTSSSLNAESASQQSWSHREDFLSNQEDCCGETCIVTFPVVQHGSRLYHSASLGRMGA